MNIDAEKLNVVHNVGAHRFEIEIDEYLAVLEYEMRGDQMVFFHTEVPPDLEGQGIANRMARVALEYAREKSYSVVPACEFIRVYLRRHPEYKSLVRH
jgi:predicted GNAT family acetyltransferase